MFEDLGYLMERFNLALKRNQSILGRIRNMFQPREVKKLIASLEKIENILKKIVNSPFIYKDLEQLTVTLEELNLAKEYLANMLRILKNNNLNDIAEPLEKLVERIERFINDVKTSRDNLLTDIYDMKQELQEVQKLRQKIEILKNIVKALKEAVTKLTPLQEVFI